QALRGDAGKWIDLSRRVHFQHLIIAKVSDIESAGAIESNSVWALEQFALSESRHRSVATNPGDVVAVPVGNVEIAAFAVNRNSNWPLQPARYDRCGVSQAVNLGDEVAVVARLRGVALTVDGVARCP